jgi:hypothetical protein
MKMNERYFKYLSDATNFQLRIWDKLFENTVMYINDSTRNVEKQIRVDSRKDFYPTKKEVEKIKKNLHLAKDTTQDFEKLNIAFNLTLDVITYIGSLENTVKEEMVKHKKSSPEKIYCDQSLDRSDDKKTLYGAILEDIPKFWVVYFPEDKLFKKDYLITKVTPQIDMSFLKDELDEKNFKNIILMRENSERCMDYINLFNLREMEDFHKTKITTN